jgi:hypothetical protein
MRERAVNKDEARPPAPSCYICGSEEPDSRDHVIPYCFFKSPRPANLLTLPAHYTCHNRLNDEYARGILSGLGSEGSGIAQELWNTKTKSSFERSAPLRKSLQASLVRKIDLISPAGLVFGHAPAIRIERDRFYPLMRKIVQGMYLHHTGELLPPMFRCAWSLNALLELSGDRQRMLEASRFGLVYPEVFGCRYLIVNEGADSASVWWLCFYTDVVLRCYVPPRHLWSSLAL